MKQLLVFLTVLVTGALLVACDLSTVKPEATTSRILKEGKTAGKTGNDTGLKLSNTRHLNPKTADPDMDKPGTQETVSWPDGEELLDKQGFVEVAVTPLNLNSTDESLKFSVGLNTHSVDLSMDLAQMAILEVDTGLLVQGLAWDAPRGGHHVSGVLSFPRMADGSSLLSNASQLTLIIYDLDAPERAFTWNLTG